MNFVFPMYVGVIPVVDIKLDACRSIPHVCGGDPAKPEIKSLDDTYSPCMWG